MQPAREQNVSIDASSGTTSSGFAMTPRISSRAVLRWATVLCYAALAGCAHQPPPPAADTPGFWMGLLHGFLMLFSLIGSIFTDVRIYAYPNSGGWYDFGFVLGVMVFVSFGGGGRVATQWRVRRRVIHRRVVDLNPDE